MLITKDLLTLSKLSKGKVSKPLHIYKDGRIMATDGFSLIETKREIKEDLDEAPIGDGEWFTIEKTVLLDSNQVFNKQKFEKSQSLPILEKAFLLKGEGDKIKIRTTDLDTCTDVQYKIEKEGECIEYENVFPENPKQQDTFSINVISKTINVLKDLGVKEITFMKEDGEVKPLVMFSDEIRALVMPIKNEDDIIEDYKKQGVKKLESIKENK